MDAIMMAALLMERKKVEAIVVRAGCFNITSIGLGSADVVRAMQRNKIKDPNHPNPTIMKPSKIFFKMIGAQK